MSYGTQTPPNDASPEPNGLGSPIPFVTPPREPSPQERFIESRLENTRRQVKSVDVTQGLLTLAVGTMFFIFLAAVLDQWVIYGGLSVAGRYAIWSVWLAISLFYFAVRVAPVLIRRVNPIYAAQTIEQYKPSLKNGLINFLLIRSRREDAAPLVLQAMESRTAAELADDETERAVDWRSVLRLGYVLAALVIIGCVYVVASPKNPLLSAARVLCPWANLHAPTRVAISDVRPGDALVFNGESVTISAEILGRRDSESVLLHYTSADGQAVDQVLVMNPANELRYQCRFPSEHEGVRQNYSYFIAAGDCRSDVYHLTTQASPEIAVERIEYRYPAYTGMAPRVEEKQGDVRALEGTEIIVRGRANMPLASARIDLNCDGRRTLAMKTNDRDAEGKFTLRLDPQDPTRSEYDSYQLLVKDEQGRPNRRPTRYRIETLADRAPTVSIVEPQREETPVERTGSTLIHVKASDPDFGLRKLRIAAEANGVPLEIPPLLDLAESEESVNGDCEKSFAFEPEKLGLKSGDRVTFWAEAEDGKTPKPNLALSAKKTLIVIEPAKIETNESDLTKSADPSADKDKKKKSDRDASGGDDPSKDTSGKGARPQGKASSDKNDKAASPDQGDSNEKNPSPQKGDSKSDPSQKNDSAQKGDSKSAADKDNSSQGDQPNESDSAGSQDRTQQENAAGDSPNKNSNQQKKTEGQPGQEDNQENGSEQQGPGMQGNGGKQKNGQQTQSKQSQGAQGEGQSQGEGTNSQNQNGQTQPGGKQSSNGKDGKGTGGERRQDNAKSDSSKNGENGSGADSARHDPIDPNANPGDAIQEILKDRQDRGQNDKGQGKSAANKSPKDSGDSKNPQQPQENDENSAGADKQDDAKQDGDSQKSQNQNASAKDGKKDSAADKSQSGKPGDEKSDGADSQSANDGQQKSNGKNAQKDGERTGQDSQSDKQPGDDKQSQKGKDGKDSQKANKQNGKSGADQKDAANSDKGDNQSQGDQSAGGDKSQGDKSDGKQSQSDQAKGDQSQGKDSSDQKSGGKNSQDKNAQKGKSGGDQTSDAEKSDKSQADADKSGGKNSADEKSAADKSQADKSGAEKGEKGDDADQGDDGKPDQADGKSSQEKDSAAQDKNKSQSDAKQGSQKNQQGNSADGKSQSDDKKNSQGKDKAEGDKQKWDGKTSNDKKQNQSGDKASDSSDASGSQQPQPQKGNAAEQNASQQAMSNPKDGGMAKGNAPEASPNETPEPGGDEVNMEYARKQTELALEHLENQLNKGDTQLLERLGWTQEEAQRFLERWKKLRQAADGSKNAEAKKELDEALRSLGLRPKSTTLRRGDVPRDAQKGMRDSGRFEAPPEWREQMRAYTKGVAEQDRRKETTKP